MSCFTPLCGVKEGAQVKIVSGQLRHVPEWRGRIFELPCGKCIGCRRDRARSWQVRIMHEAQLYDSNWMATLTYRDEELPWNFSLEYRDFQLFMKRLRRQCGGEQEGPEGGYPLRFFCAGEYGGVTKRPHFHAILFNFLPRNLRKFSDESYHSSELEEIWELGHAHLVPLTPGIAGYVAQYAQKKKYGYRSEEYYEDVVNMETGETYQRRKEFCAMSLKPGIGSWWYDRYGKDVFPLDAAVVSGGNRYKVPRYYTERFKNEGDPLLVEEVLRDRMERALLQRSESTPERRAVREEVALRREALFEERGL